MNILGIISYKVFPAQMGGQKGIADFYQYLSKQANITLAVSKENETAGFLTKNVHPFLFNHWLGLLNILYLKRLIRLIKDNDIDTIIIEHSYFGWLGYLLKRFTGKPFAIHSHNIEAHRFELSGKKIMRFYEPFEKWMHQKADFSFFKCEEDAKYALQYWEMDSTKVSVLPYGTILNEVPSEEEKKNCRKWLIGTHALKENHTIFYFNGTLDYAPNVHALNIVMNTIIPSLRKKLFPFYIILTGKNLSEALNAAIKDFPEIIYAGLVNDVSLYLKGVDAFINPTAKATGIKTKLVEALANDTSVISTKTGARGIDKKITNNKLILVADDDFVSFINEMIQSKFNSLHTPTAFYANFYWGNIISKALLSLRSL